MHKATLPPCRAPFPEDRVNEASLGDEAIEAVWNIWSICGARIYRVKLPGSRRYVPVIVWRGETKPEVLDDPRGTLRARRAAYAIRKRLLGELEGGGVMLSDPLLRDALALAPKEGEE